MDILPTYSNLEDYADQNRAIITCWLPLQTMGKSYIQQNLIKPDTMSTLISDTLVSLPEPPSGGWRDIILEQTFE